MLRLRTQGGFANRLRAIISGVLWAQDLGVRLGIYWPVEPGHMPCALWELFLETSIPELEEVHSGYLPGAIEVQSVEAAEKAIHTRCIESYSEFHPECKTERGLQILRGLKFRPEILAKADEIWQKIGGTKEWYGIHYRGTDHKKCKTACTPGLLIGKIQDCLADNKNQMFFLATDEESVGGTILFKFPTSVIMPSLIKSRFTKEGQIEAILDWICLSRCERIYGSKGSTFSEWAALYGSALYFPLSLSLPTHLLKA